MAASQPIISVASAPRSSASRDGWLIAISTRSTSSASGDWKTLACDISTLPISSLASSRFTSLPCACVRTRIAMSPGRSLRSPIVMRPLSPSVTSRAISAAVAFAAIVLAVVLGTGSPSGVWGSVHTCRSARFAVLSEKGLRGLVPISTR